MASINLADAYSTVPCMDRKCFLFQFKENSYQYTCLTYVLSSAPRIFIKTLKPVFSALKKEGYQFMGYLDDTFLMGDTFNECKNPMLASGKLITDLGFSLHPEKSKLSLSQVIQFLNFITNTKQMTVSLPEFKQIKLKQSLRR